MKRKIIILLFLFIYILSLTTISQAVSNYTYQYENLLTKSEINSNTLIKALKNNDEKSTTIQVDKLNQKANELGFNSGSDTISISGLDGTKQLSMSVNKCIEQIKQKLDGENWNVFYFDNKWYGYKKTSNGEYENWTTDSAAIFPPSLIDISRYNTFVYRSGTNLYLCIFDTYSPEGRQKYEYNKVYRNKLNLKDYFGYYDYINVPQGQKVDINWAKERMKEKIPNYENLNNGKMDNSSIEYGKNTIATGQKSTLSDILQGAPELDKQCTISYMTERKSNGKYAVALNYYYDQYDRMIWYNFTEVKQKKGETDADAKKRAIKEADTVNGKSQLAAKAHNVSGEDRATDNFKDDVLTNLDSYNPTGVGDDAGTSATIEKMTSKILTVISNIGIAVSVIVLAILGVKYMIGSVEEKAEYKQEMVPYLIGTFILFGITSIVRILIAFGQTINTL